MATISLTAMLGSGTYDDVSGVVSFTIAPALPNDESVVLGICEKLEATAQNKRTNINFPISQKAFPDSPDLAITARSNADSSVTETQIEKIYQFVGWYKAPQIVAENAVNNND